MTYTDRYNIVFDFHKRHSPSKNNAEYWEKVSNDMIALTQKYNDEFMTSLLVAVYNELSRNAKEKSNDG